MILRKYQLQITPTSSLGPVQSVPTFSLLPRPHGHAHNRVRVRVENLLSQQYSLNRDVLFSYLDRRNTWTRRRPTVYRVWTLTGIWFLSAAAAARTSTVVLTSSN